MPALHVLIRPAGLQPLRSSLKPVRRLDEDSPKFFQWKLWIKAYARLLHLKANGGGIHERKNLIRVRPRILPARQLDHVGPGTLHAYPLGVSHASSSTSPNIVP